MKFRVQREVFWQIMKKYYSCKKSLPLIIELEGEPLDPDEKFIKKVIEALKNA